MTYRTSNGDRRTYKAPADLLVAIHGDSATHSLHSIDGAHEREVRPRRVRRVLFFGFDLQVKHKEPEDFNKVGILEHRAVSFFKGGDLTVC